MKKLLLIISLTFLCVGAYAKTPIALKSEHPTRYVVKPGDTIWGIAERFLQEPWRWRELWQANKHIKNPEKLYPGDIIVIQNTKGKNQVHVEKGGVVKLTPQMRITKINKAIPSIPIDSIKPFINDIRLVKEDELKDMAQVLRPIDERLIVGAGEKVFVEGLAPSKLTNYQIFRKAEAYRDPKNKKVLGFEAQHIGDARLVASGDPATVLITKAHQEVRPGDYLLPKQESVEPNLYYFPKLPSKHIEARIIRVLGGITQVAQWQIVAINSGSNSGLAVGDVLSVYHKRTKAKSQKKRGWFSAKKIELPDTRIAEMLIFRTFDKVSYGLIMSARGGIKVNDRVANPS